MKHFANNIITLLLLATTTVFVLSCKDEEKDTTAPTIESVGFETNPIDCQRYHCGDTIAVRYRLCDNIELGNFNIEIHNNFDHHTHGTSSVECEEHEHKHGSHSGEASGNAWIFNQNYTIPSGSKSYNINLKIAIPATAQHGDYHFAIRVTDQTGWQQIKSIAIEIADDDEE